MILEHFLNRKCLKFYCSILVFCQYFEKTKAYFIKILTANHILLNYFIYVYDRLNNGSQEYLGSSIWKLNFTLNNKMDFEDVIKLKRS